VQVQIPFNQQILEVGIPIPEENDDKSSYEENDPDKDVG
jgi:hypothetical protein